MDLGLGPGSILVLCGLGSTSIQAWPKKYMGSTLKSKSNANTFRSSS